MDRCPYCDSDFGVYKTYTGKQYYDFDGEPAGFYSDVPDNQIIFARCIQCGRRISMERIRREAERNKS